MKIKLALLILCLVPVISLLHSGFPVTHDGQDHVARVANFYQNLSDGNIIPRWAANLNWGYGHPILEFLYPAPSYFASFFHFLGFSLFNSIKIVLGIGIVFSLIFMYLWLSQFMGKYSALIGAVLYTYAPYRFVDLNVRGDIGENLAFAFIPLVLFFIYRIYKKNQLEDAIFTAISLGLLILSHNAVSLVLMPFIFFYSILLLALSKNRRKILINLIFALFMGFGLAAFFWIPGLLEGKYTLRNIVTEGEYVTRFVSFKDLIYSPWSYGGTGQFTVQLGIFQWIAILALPFLIFKNKNNKYKLYLLASLFLLTIISIFLMLPISKFIWERLIILQNFQFPWRFLSLIVFTGALLFSFLFEEIPNKYKNKILAFCLISIIFLSFPMLKPKGYFYKPEGFFKGVYEGTTDTGESAPIWSVRFMERKPSTHLQLIDGDAKIKELERKSTYHKYKIDVLSNSLLRENTLYFPGWEIRADNKKQKIEFQNSNHRGLMLFSLPKGSYVVEAIYKETKLRLLSNVISLVVLSNLIIGLILVKIVKNKNSHE